MWGWSNLPRPAPMEVNINPPPSPLFLFVRGCVHRQSPTNHTPKTEEKKTPEPFVINFQ